MFYVQVHLSSDILKLLFKNGSAGVGKIVICDS